ncbi:hypothetical protein H5410_021360 [Solanum commersonii]|uniref:Uncharacterized protein n=1 Tax=Solanum commersonii TaxID=4109 RepID=A0A9J5ZDS0_SOLCO|nr:hypothetical protein H5410_021360 [Solanum commersonii]
MGRDINEFELIPKIIKASSTTTEAKDVHYERNIVVLVLQHHFFSEVELLIFYSKFLLMLMKNFVVILVNKVSLASLMRDEKLIVWD